MYIADVVVSFDCLSACPLALSLVLFLLLFLERKYVAYFIAVAAAYLDYTRILYNRHLHEIDAQPEVKALLGPVMRLRVVRYVIVDLDARQLEDPNRQAHSHCAANFSCNKKQFH